MYMVYLNNMLFPVAPEKIVTEYEFENKMYQTVDGRWISRPGGRGLKKFTLRLLLPMRVYPFAQYEGSFCNAEYYLEELERISSDNTAVDFDVYKSMAGSDVIYLTSVKVILEKMTVTDDANNGDDIVAELVLREYRNVETKTTTEKNNTYAQRADEYIPPKTYVVKSGDSLWMISKMFFGDGAKYLYLAELNGIKKPYTIYTGQVLRISE